MNEFTFALIKPDAVKAGHANAIMALITENGFSIERKKEMRIDKATAERFYAVHKDRPFFGELIEFITSGPVVAMALHKSNADAITDWRNLMGATNPADAKEGTIRKLYGTSIGNNAAHGSDSAENAKYELAIFFPDLELDDASCCSSC